MFFISCNFSILQADESEDECIRSRGILLEFNCPLKNGASVIVTKDKSMVQIATSNNDE